MNLPEEKQHLTEMNCWWRHKHATCPAKLVAYHMEAVGRYSASIPMIIGATSTNSCICWLKRPLLSFNPPKFHKRLVFRTAGHDTVPQSYSKGVKTISKHIPRRTLDSVPNSQLKTHQNHHHQVNHGANLAPPGLADSFEDARLMSREGAADDCAAVLAALTLLDIRW